MEIIADILEIMSNLSGYTYIKDILKEKKTFKNRSDFFLNAFSIVLTFFLMIGVFILLIYIYNSFA